MAKWKLLFAASLVLSGSRAVLAGPPAAELRNGRWQPVDQPATQPVNDPDLDRVEQLLNAGNLNAAYSSDLQWIKSHDKTAPLRDRAILLMGRIYDRKDDGLSAFYYYDEVMDEYPEGKLFYSALEQQYKIADEYLKGRRLKFLWLPIVPAEEQGIEMLYRIQNRSPGSPLAEKSLLRTADYYYAHADYDLAHDAYGSYIKAYPRSPMVPQVKLRQAFASLAQFHGIRFDPSHMLDARSELADVATAYPEMARDENVASVIAAIDDTLAAKLLETANFYQRTNEKRGAVYTYRYLIATYPDAQQVAKAKAALAVMPQWALDQPEPQTGSAFLPPTGGGKEPR